MATGLRLDCFSTEITTACSLARSTHHYSFCDLMFKILQLLPSLVGRPLHEVDTGKLQDSREHEGKAQNDEVVEGGGVGDSRPGRSPAES